MLIRPELEKLLPQVDNRYTLSIVIAKRVRQLLNGALPLAETDSNNLVTLASQELAEGKIACVKGHVNPYIPLRPEVEAARMAARAAAEQADLADAVKDALDQAAGIEASAPAGKDDAAIIVDSLITVTEPEEEQAQEIESDADDTASQEADESEQEVAKEEVQPDVEEEI